MPDINFLIIYYSVALAAQPVSLYALEISVQEFSGLTDRQSKTVTTTACRTSKYSINLPYFNMTNYVGFGRMTAIEKQCSMNRELSSTGTVGIRLLLMLPDTIADTRTR